MIHPDTELRYIDDLLGCGVFATRLIPKGTITWVRDDLDQTLSPKQFARLTPPLRALVDRYSFVDGVGDRVLCWDHARYVNHACEPSCLAPGYGFEIAVRDIPAGAELTDDYGALNIEAPFVCRCGSPSCRKEIHPSDMLTLADRWDAAIAESFERLLRVEQPLWDLVREKDEVRRALARGAPIASCRQNYFAEPSPPGEHPRP